MNYEKTKQKEITQNFQIKKFCLYGFFKNLQFFKPYLFIFLIGNGLSLLQIGILISIREVVVNIFEIPSGVFADYFGRKKMLLLCFIFYITSFIFFFLSTNFFLATISMIFFGLGEAFRSGTHKAIIYTYLEEKNWQDHKTFVYGKTRSYSLIGTALSSILAIVIILKVPHSRFIFLASIIPYILDFFLILSYPNFLDKTDTIENKNLLQIIRATVKELSTNLTLRKLMLSEGLFDGMFKTLENFIQPILSAIILGSGFLVFNSLNSDTNLKIILGVVYGFINLINAISSRKAFIVKNKFGIEKILNYSYVLLSLFLICLAIFIDKHIIVILAFLIFNILLNIRKPVFVEAIGNEISKNKRATVLSICSQLKSLTVIIIAPIVGYLSDNYSISFAMLTCGGFVLFTSPIILLKHKNYRKISID